MLSTPARHRRPRRASHILSVIALAAGCVGSGSGQPDEDLGGLVHRAESEPETIVVDAISGHPDRLLSAALTPHARVGELLGAHSFRGKSTVEVREGDSVVDSLSTETSIELAADGQYHAVSKNSKDYGREVIFADDYLYLAPRYSKFHRRRPENPDEPAEIRGQMYGELGAHLELVAGGIAAAESGQKTVSGRAARVFGIAKSARPGPAKSEVLRQRRWRESITVDSVAGEIALDAETGVPLAGTLEATVSFRRDNRSFTMSFSVEHGIAGIGEPVTVTAPLEDRWVATPTRSREVEERDRLLRGIAPPTRKAAAPPAESSGSQPVTKKPGQ